MPYGQLMQHKKVSLHRSTVWRQKNGRVKKTGRGRRSKSQDDEALGLAAGVVDLIREAGSCYAWQLKVFPREIVRYDSKTKRLVHSPSPANQKTQPLSGSDESIHAMNESGLPVGLLLYAAAYIAQTRGGLEYDEETVARDAVKHRETIKLITGKNPSGPASILAADSDGKLIRDEKGKLIRPAPYRPWDARRKQVQAREDAKQAFDYGRQLDSEMQDEAEDFRDGLDADDEDEGKGGVSDPTRSKKRGAIHKVPEFRDCGLSKQTCSKWRNDKRFTDALRVVAVLLDGSLPSAQPSPVYKR